MMASADGLNSEYYSKFLSDQQADDFLKLFKNYEFEPLQFNLYGSTFTPSRTVYAFSDAGLSYTFSGQTIEGREWNSSMLDLKKEVEVYTKQEFNYALLNFYPDGNSRISPHADDEPSLDPTAWIATVSLGATRKLIFSRQHYPSQTCVLEHGSLLLMKPPTQLHWKHAIPAEVNVTQPRISVTFRKMLPKGLKRKCSDEIPEARSRPDECFQKWDLGNNIALSLNVFKNHLNINIREYVVRGDNSFPTVRGVVLSPKTWGFFVKKMKDFSFHRIDTSCICDNSLLVINDGGEFILQNILVNSFNPVLLKKNGVRCSASVFYTLKEYAPEISKKLQEVILMKILPHSILQEARAFPCESDLEPFSEIILALEQNAETFIRMLFDCDACELDDPSQFNHFCMSSSTSDQIFKVGNDIIYSLDVDKIVKYLKDKKVLNVFTEDFFTCQTVDTYMQGLYGMRWAKFLK